MAIDIKALIRGRREARAGGIEELAQRLAKGEAVAPEEIEAWLEQTGTDESILQERIDCLERRGELLAKVSIGNKAQAKADKLRAEIETAYDAVLKAQANYAAVLAKHEEALTLLEADVRAGQRAHGLLIAPENLSAADRDRLAAAREAAGEADRALSELRSSLPAMRLSLEQAERVYADAEDQAKANRSNADIQNHRARSENSVKARKARLADAVAELPKRQAAFDEADAAVKAIEAELRK